MPESFTSVVVGPTKAAVVLATETDHCTCTDDDLSAPHTMYDTAVERRSMRVRSKLPPSAVIMLMLGRTFVVWHGQLRRDSAHSPVLHCTCVDAHVVSALQFVEHTFGLLAQRTLPGALSFGHGHCV